MNDKKQKIESEFDPVQGKAWVNASAYLFILKCVFKSESMKGLKCKKKLSELLGTKVDFNKCNYV